MRENSRVEELEVTAMKSLRHILSEESFSLKSFEDRAYPAEWYHEKDSS